MALSSGSPMPVVPRAIFVFGIAAYDLVREPELLVQTGEVRLAAWFRRYPITQRPFVISKFRFDWSRFGANSSFDERGRSRADNQGS